MFNTPVLIIIFNRPETTKLLIEVLRNIKPKYLYVWGDQKKKIKIKKLKLVLV